MKMLQIMEGYSQLYRGIGSSSISISHISCLPDNDSDANGHNDDNGKGDKNEPEGHSSLH